MKTRTMTSYEKGKRMILTFDEEGFYQGQQILFDENNSIKRITTYKNNIKDGIELLFNNGKIIKENVYHDGKLITSTTYQ